MLRQKSTEPEHGFIKGEVSTNRRGRIEGGFLSAGRLPFFILTSSLISGVLSTDTGAKSLVERTYSFGECRCYRWKSVGQLATFQLLVLGRHSKAVDSIRYIFVRYPKTNVIFIRTRRGDQYTLTSAWVTLPVTISSDR